MVQIINPQIYATSNADYLVGGKVYSYVADTLTLKATYQTVEDAKNGTNPNTNPVILDSKGRARIVTAGPTKLVLKDANDNEIWTVNDIDTSTLNLFDSNGNEVLIFNAAANAINGFEVRNAATGAAPRVSALGNDANIDVHLKPKGSGNVTIAVGGLQSEQGSLTITAGSVTITNGDVNLISGNLTVDNLESISNVPLISSGTIAWFAGSSCPSGWLECNGGAVSRTTYASLFAAVSTSFGVGDGSTTFNLPNQARRTLVGKGGSSSATLSNTVGSTGGAETHTISSAEMTSHSHSYKVGDLDNTVNVASGGSPQATRNISSPANTQTTSSTGSGDAHNIMQPSLVMMMVIRV